jgi:hypothetical protein
MTPYPEVIKNRPEEFTQRHKWVSIDFEFHPSDMLNPTEVSFSSGSRPVSSVYGPRSRDLMERLDRGECLWVGHNFLTTEKKIIESELGRPVPLSRCEDTMILHYAANAHLCKSAAKDEDEEDPRGQGFMDLWSMSSLYTDLPQWKRCRGTHCEGPCRVHDHLGYNGVDAYAVDLALPNLYQDLAQKQIPQQIIDHLKGLMLVCDAMQRQGITVDRPEVERLEREMQTRKDKLFPSRLEPRYHKKTGVELKTKELVWDAPFNPRAPQAVVEWFGGHGISLESASKEDIGYALAHLPSRVDPEAAQWLEHLYDYKAEGKGLSPWFDSRYFAADGLMHPRFNPVGTSTIRLSSSRPNFQNIPRVGFGKNVRRVIVPRSPDSLLAKADKSQLELRMVLWYAGVFEKLPKNKDAFSWLVEAGNGVFEKAEEIAQKGWTPRDHAKSVSHGADYGEGFKLYYSKDLDSPRIKRMIEDGALVVHRDWEYHGGLVGFTGSNLAVRLFGDASWPNRAKALAIQEAYFEAFPEIRAWQKTVTRDAERGYVRSAAGNYLELYGSPEDKAKIAFAFYGQGGGAIDVQEAMLRYYEMGYTPLIQVHDELVFELPVTTTDSELLEFFSVFSAESRLLPGFSGPVKVSRGPNWLDQQEIGKV